MTKWTLASAPSQAGKFAIVTGGTSGIGYDTALDLAKLGAEVLITGRNEAAGQKNVERIQAAVPGAKVSYKRVDLSSLASVRDFAESIKKERKHVDILVANAGLILGATRDVSVDGNELTFASNHLGHFALIGQLLPQLRGGRVTSVSSMAAKSATSSYVDDLQGEKKYGAWYTYGGTKLCNLLFTQELQRRSDAAGWGITATVAHPGGSRTGFGSSASTPTWLMLRAVVPILGQSSAWGALPTVRAAVEPNVQPAAYFGPRFLEAWGAPVPVDYPPLGKDVGLAKKLWEASERLSGVAYA